MPKELKPCYPRNFANRNMRAWCGGCGIDTGWDGLREWYSVQDEVWESAWPGTSTKIIEPNGPRYFLCIGCLEERLGRKLTRADFTPGEDLYYGSSRSARLLDRLRRA